MGESLNIKEVIDRSTSQVSLQDLTRKGVKRVKVLNQDMITRLIAEAVDKVIRDRAHQLSSAEREKIVEASRRQFQELAKKALAREKSRAADLERQLSELKQRFEGSGELHGEIEKAMERLQQLEGDRDRLQRLLETREKELATASQTIASKDEDLAARDAELESRRQELDARHSELARREEELAGRERSTQERQTELTRREAELRSAREELDRSRSSDETASRAEKERADGLECELKDRERELARMEGELAAKNEEIKRLASVGDSLAERVLSSISEREETARSSSSDSDLIRESLDGLRKTLSTLASRGGLPGGGSMDEVDTDTLLKFVDHGDDLSMKTNISKVKVEEKKSKGVGSSLARLKQLREGV